MSATEFAAFSRNPRNSRPIASQLLGPRIASRTLLSAAFLEHADANVLAVDWGRHAAPPWYQTAAQATEAVGGHLAALLDHLADRQGLRAARTHLVGFSLGAHVAGHAGKSLRSGRLRRITGTPRACNKGVSNIRPAIKGVSSMLKERRYAFHGGPNFDTHPRGHAWQLGNAGSLLSVYVLATLGPNSSAGLDPARVLFEGLGPKQRLDKADADVVEVVHSSGGYLGFSQPLGHRDFFPNGGEWPQPGCVFDFVCKFKKKKKTLLQAIYGGSFRLM